MITCALILAPEITFLSTTALYFPIVVPLISAFLCFFSVFYLFLIATSDPGYIQRQEYPFAIGPEASPTIYKALINEPFKASAIENAYFEHSMNGSRIKIKYCRSCWIVRPPRASHCPDCDLCVEKFDHHCPWVGICIGKYNYVKFLGFVYCTLLLALFDLCVCLTHIVDIGQGVHNGQSQISVLEKAGPSIFIGFFVLLFIVFVGGLGGFHFVLICKAFTTNEIMKKSYRYIAVHPYLQGTWTRNLMSICKVHKGYRLNLQEEVPIGNKERCFHTHSHKALARSLELTEFDRPPVEFKDLEKDHQSETPSIIHENVKST